MDEGYYPQDRNIPGRCRNIRELHIHSGHKMGETDCANNRYQHFTEELNGYDSPGRYRP